jgi:HEAT repeat protein
MKWMKCYRYWHMTALIALLAFCGQAYADERTLTPEQLEALNNDGELGGGEEVRPGNLPDLTKGEPAGEPGKYGERIWPLGPTGMYGHMVGGPNAGDQIEVSTIAAGSPAEGKLKWGDVIIGVAGKKFVAGQHLGMTLGKAIIEAEREENNGRLKLLVWRDKNFLARNGKKDIANEDVDDLIAKAEGDNTLYDWVPEEKRAEVVRSSNFDEFPIDSEVMEITLQLEVFPDYSDTSPYNCPKAKKILENAWKVLEGQFEAGKIGASRNGAIAALALVASGKPEHRELVREWVRSPKAQNWHPSIADKLDINRPGGFQSWRMSFDGLDAAIYYDATGDDFVLPAIKAYAVHTAKGQAGGGSWGHTFAWPIFNGGELHGMNPGYGALNAAGNRCFMLIALAKKQGIEHPEIDLAIERSSKFFGSYYEKGAIPYGHHGAAASDDSNGKNVGVAFAFKFLGDDERARWFAQMSSHASFTRRGGHGSGWLWHYTPWAATMLGPEITIAAHRNLRWRYTLCRMYDGSFTCHSNYGKENLRNPTATYAMHYSSPMKQTLFSGKDADEAMFWKEEEFADLLTIAQGQFNDPTLLEKAGTPVTQRDTQEVFQFLSAFKPKARHIFARELAKRYNRGEKDILPKLGALLKSDDPRERDAACHALEHCGPDATMQYLAGVAKLLNDKNEFVRMRAASAMAKASASAATKAAVLQSNLDNEDTETMSPNSLPSVTQAVLFGEGSSLASDPFDAGIDDELVRSALEKFITLDPAGNRPLMGNRALAWDKQTAVRLAGPLVYAAEQEQIADQMFSSRRPNTLKFLNKHGYQEYVDASASYLRRYLEIPRDVRGRVFYKRGQVVAKNLMANAGNAKHYLDDLALWLADKPLDLAYKGNKEDPVDIRLYELIDAIKAAEAQPALPSIADDAARYFQDELDKLPSDSERVAVCRRYLKAIDARDTFRKINALSYLAKTQDAEAFADVLPYLGHRDWRLSGHAHAVSTGLVAEHGDKALVTAFGSAKPYQAAAILGVLAEAKSKAAEGVAKQALTHDSPSVRGAAASALITLAGEAALPGVLEAMAKETNRAALLGYENAILSLVEQPSAVALIRSRSIALLDGSEPQLRNTLVWLIAQTGGPVSMDALATLIAENENDEQLFAVIMNALSYSPDPAADKYIIDAIRASSSNPRNRILARKAELAANEGVRRMVMSPAGPGNRPIEEQLDYAEAVLKMTLNEKTIAYLGRIRTGRCAYILQDAMRRGAPSSAGMAIVEATRDLSDSTKKDREYAEKALVDVIEFIEVTYIRGTAEDYVKKTKDEQMAYMRWKSISAQAGKNLLKLTQNKEPDPLPEFDDTDLDF